MSFENYSRVDIKEGSSNRSFGLVFAIFFLVNALLPLLDGSFPRYWSVAASFLLLLISLLKPSFLALPNMVWAKLGALLHRIVNPLVLAVLFYFIITPYSLFMRIFRKDQLGLRKDPPVESYWQKRTVKVQDMKHQF
ncbi:MAG: SxtJ family membrane protein [Desulfuromonadaceae bacterium]|nr:SxtJ family membrane protein [Desulfuromonadaceae bacterium]MDD2855385.1 SxtJ family membrane protein [Desulfuromonadaceae bacterium]